jgi:hypothetical protein
MGGLTVTGRLGFPPGIGLPALPGPGFRGLEFRGRFPGPKLLVPDGTGGLLPRFPFACIGQKLGKEFLETLRGIFRPPGRLES